MQYIIIIIVAIVAIAIVIALIRHVLFNPKLNSVLTIIGLGALCVVWRDFPIFGYLVVISLIAAIDCIRDIALANELYEDVNDEIDRAYAVKSILSIFTVGHARVIFILIIVPVISLKASSDVKNKMLSGYPLEHISKSKHGNYNYFYRKKIRKLCETGELISNEKTRTGEMKLSRERLDKLYPEKLIAKLVDAVAGDKDMKQRRKDAEQRISADTGIAYVTAADFKKYPQALIDVMSQKSMCSPIDIKDFKELKSLHFDTAIDGSTDWAVYFIILALQPLVEKGEFSDDPVNDKDVLDNHAYSYSQSTKQIASVDGDNDPRFALDKD